MSLLCVFIFCHQHGTMFNKDGTFHIKHLKQSDKQLHIIYEDTGGMKPTLGVEGEDKPGKAWAAGDCLCVYVCACACVRACISYVCGLECLSMCIVCIRAVAVYMNIPICCSVWF